MSEGLSDVIDQYDSINEFTIPGEFGFKRFEGPFEADKDGTVWAIVVPKDTHPIVDRLPDEEGSPAVIIADGETVGGGLITDVVEPEEHDEFHVLVDQYAMGDVDG